MNSWACEFLDAVPYRYALLHDGVAAGIFLPKPRSPRERGAGHWSAWYLVDLFTWKSDQSNCSSLSLNPSGREFAKERSRSAYGRARERNGLRRDFLGIEKLSYCLTTASENLRVRRSQGLRSSSCCFSLRVPPWRRGRRRLAPQTLVAPRTRNRALVSLTFGCFVHLEIGSK